MSCDHNTTEFKYCPECGIKIDNDELAVKELNDIYIDYKQKLVALNFVESIYMSFQGYIHSNNILKCDVVYLADEDRFYSIKEYISKTNDTKYIYTYVSMILENNLYRIYRTNHSFDYIRNSMKKKELSDKNDKMISHIINSFDKKSKEDANSIQMIARHILDIKMPKGLLKNVLCDMIDKIDNNI
jgi:hypothetical protein